MIDAIQVAIDFGTQPAARHRVIGAPAHADGLPMLIYLRLQRAAVGAVVRACAIHNAQVTRLFNIWKRLECHVPSFRCRFDLLVLSLLYTMGGRYVTSQFLFNSLKDTAQSPTCFSHKNLI